MREPIIPEDLKEAHAHFVDSMLHHKFKSVDGATMVYLIERIGRVEHERDEVLAEVKALLAEVSGSISFTLPPVAFFIAKLQRIIERAE